MEISENKLNKIENKIHNQKITIILLSISTTLFTIILFITTLTSIISPKTTKVTIHFSTIIENIYSQYPSFELQITTDKDVIISYEDFTTLMEDTETGKKHYIGISDIRYYGTNTDQYDYNKSFIAYANKVNTITIKSSPEPSSYKLDDKYAVYYRTTKLNKGDKITIEI